MHDETTHRVEEVGSFLLPRQKKDSLSAGDVGYIIAGIKTLSDVQIGDTITSEKRPRKEPLAGFKESKPVVFASIYPIASDDYEELAVSLEKYKLNDASFVYQKDSSSPSGRVFVAVFLAFCILRSFRKGWKGNMICPSFCPSPASDTALH